MSSGGARNGACTTGAPFCGSTKCSRADFGFDMVDKFLKELPVDKQAVFNPRKSYESNVLAPNGRKYVMKNTSTPGSELPFVASLPYDSTLEPPKPTGEVFVPFSTVCAPIYRHMPYNARAAPAVKPVDLKASSKLAGLPNADAIFLTPFQG